MGEVVLFMEEFKPSSAIAASCRICHGEEEEEEGESCKSLEVPCACSGTLMFAHRDCIQRWCNQKGNTTCEICLQKFEPGYTTPPSKSQLIDAIVTIRGSLEVVIREREVQHSGSLVHAEGQMLETNSSQCSPSTDWTAICCITMVLVFTSLLLARLLLLVLSIVEATKDYPFTLVTFIMLILRASEILLPIYIFMRVITAIGKKIRPRH